MTATTPLASAHTLGEHAATRAATAMPDQSAAPEMTVTGPQAAEMPTLAATRARRGSTLQAVLMLGAALLVLAVYVGTPLVHTMRFASGALLPAVLLALVVSAVFAYMVIRILRATHHPMKRPGS